MKKTPRARRDPDMRPEYDFTNGVRNKYAARMRAGTNVVLLDPDVAAAFKTSEEVNRALRALLDLVPVKRSPRKRTA
jgi:hypothetical protein